MNTTLQMGEIVISHLLRRGLRNQSGSSSVQQPNFKHCAQLIKVANFLRHHATVRSGVANVMLRRVCFLH